MKFYLILTLLLLFVSVEVANGAGRKKIKNWSTTTTTTTDAPTSTDVTTISTTPIITTTISPLTTKSIEKLSYPKKVTSLKKRPTKTPSGSTQLSTKVGLKKKKTSNVTDKFKDLPADDLEFIKELDKQFQLHGDKIKIKVENANSTTTKNSKRTIEGELGYGYSHNGYNYDPPKFMFYPYSQSDIAANAADYHSKTDVTIQPSYSYELEPETYAVHSAQPQIDLPYSHSGEHGQQQQQQEVLEPTDNKYQEPVIVLRIPGPAKYASHLQALLQQYLEIRAAQYLRLLEEADLRKQQGEEQQHDEQQHQQHQQQQQQQQLSYEQNHQQQYEQQQQLAYHNNVQQQHNAEEEAPQYAPEVSYSQQIAPTPQPVNYAAIDDVYQGYKSRQQQLHQHYSQPEIQQPAQAYYSEEQSYHGQSQSAEDQQNYYYPQQQQQQQDAGGHNPHASSPADPSYNQHVYLIAMTPQPYYPEQQDQQQQVYTHESEQIDQNAAHLAVSENNPRSTHTKVLFNQHAPRIEAPVDYNNMYQLPSIRPYERHAPTPSPTYREHYQQQQQHHQQQQQQQAQSESLDYQQVTANVPQATVAITQRPYNYHAHSLRGRMRGQKRGTAINTETTAATENPLDKIREYVRDKLGAEMGSAVQIKTTQVINRNP